MAWSEIGFWTVASVLVLINATGLVLNAFLLPGNWLMVAGLLMYLVATRYDIGPTWGIFIVSLGLAGLGEVLETVMGSARAAKRGASRRAMLLSLGFSIAGSLSGTFLVPIPVVGSVIGAVAGAASGAFVGAWLGEAWKGTDPDRRTQIGTAAMTGRLWGMAIKFVIGAGIFAMQLLSFFF